MKIIKAPEHLPLHRVKGLIPKSVFLAGSIESGKAENWQEEVTKELERLGCEYVLNPRRDDWDSSWEQSIHNENFNEQVSWEMTALDAAETILMYLAAGTISPISLLELGLYAESGKLVVGCPFDFHRRGNVEMVCERYQIPLRTGWKWALLENRFDFKSRKNEKVIK